MDLSEMYREAKEKFGKYGQIQVSKFIHDSGKSEPTLGHSLVIQVSDEYKPLFKVWPSCYGSDTWEGAVEQVSKELKKGLDNGKCFTCGQEVPVTEPVK